MDVFIVLPVILDSRTEAVRKVRRKPLKSK